MKFQRSLAAAVCLFIFALVPACPPPPTPDGNENSSNTNTNTNTNSANGNANSSTSTNGNANSGGNVTLTVLIEAPSVTPSLGVAIYVNKGNVDRAEADDPIARDFSVNFFSGETIGSSPRSFPRGTQITLICDESDEISSPFNTTVSPPLIAAQFLDWQGDVSGAGGNDAGALFFTLNENRTITARFGLMNGVIIRSVGGANGTGTLLDIDFLERAPFTIPPQFLFGNSRNGNVVGTGLTGQQGQIGRFHFARDGTVIKFTVPMGAAFTSWSGDGAISGREITFTVGNRTQTADLAWP
ncbi:MAG: hypothetical protein SF069_04595 [Phycisphaerae bacterium]|nr:hypothetical protein [Phycisphaerae bacterium]